MEAKGDIHKILYGGNLSLAWKKAQNLSNITGENDRVHKIVRNQNYFNETGMECIYVEVVGDDGLVWLWREIIGVPMDIQYEKPKVGTTNIITG